MHDAWQTRGWCAVCTDQFQVGRRNFGALVVSLKADHMLAQQLRCLMTAQTTHEVHLLRLHTVCLSACDLKNWV